MSPKPRLSPAVAAVVALAAPVAGAEPTGLLRWDVADETPRLRLSTDDEAVFTLGGYLETYYSWNAGRPSNRISEFRAFDNKHDSFTLQSLALDLGWKSRRLELRFVAQTGSGPDTYYSASEPRVLGTALTPTTGAASFRHVREAWFAYSPVEGRLAVEGGVFLSPIGPEGMPTFQNFHWSHSILFFGLPFYHAGARLRYTPSSRHTLRLGVYNGWNSVVDGNAEKTVGLDYTYQASAATSLGAAYFGGVERPSGAPEGRAFRHLFELHGVAAAATRVTLLGQLDGGFEDNRFGRSHWRAANAAVRLELGAGWFVAGRGSVFEEHRAAGAEGVAAPIAIPAKRISSGTLTLETRPVPGLSFKLEGRYDHASEAVYFRRRVEGDGSDERPYVPNAKDQLTCTLGAAAWF